MATRDEEREKGKQPGVKTPEVPHVPKPGPEMPGPQGRTGMEEPDLPTPGPEVGGRAPRNSGVAEMPRPTEKPGP